MPSQRKSDAIYHLEQAIRLDPNYADPLFHLGQLLLGEGRRSAAATRLQEAVTLAIASAESAGENAVAQAGNHRFSRARQSLLKAREQQQLAAEAAFSLARLHQSAGRDGAEEMLATATVCDPAHAEAHYLLGRVRQQQGDLPEARKLLELCVGSNYAHGAAHIALAQVITAEDEQHLARNHYLTALDMDATLATGELEERFGE
ncbi:MAG: tetratricopeptide repeat protein [Candidatus Marinimicrobia bacterium]|nr:tetratricopeptide repeat protein [Candidatus Neomarinimicrobiota bacterium]